MRNPSLAKKEGDLSRLTSSSSSSREHSSVYLPDTEIIPSNFTSNYLPEVIDPLVEWQVSRKRKERQDSTSSTTQDKKLVRSNSEEYIPNVDYEVIRRVVSHEEFKHPLQDKTNGNLLQNHQHQDENHGKLSPNNNEVQEILRETHRRTETSPARSRTFDYSHKYRISPHRDNRQNGKSVLDDNDGEHERRRNSERFCKARAQPGRKSQSSKKSTKYLASKLRNKRDENVYKYDITVLKCERRGFVSKAKPTEDRYITNKDEDDVLTRQDQNDNHIGDIYAGKSPIIKKSQNKVLPWDQSCPDDTPVICPRFADDPFDHVAQFRDVNLINNRNIPSNNGLKNFVSVENMKTRQIMQSLPPTNVFSSPDERLKQINKRLVALKKRVNNFEEVFERENGFRPSHSEKLNDKFIKYALGEIHKLRKDKQLIKSDPAAAMGLITTQQGGDKIPKMKETLIEIEKRLQEKRMEENRPIKLEDMTPDQLLQEKTAVQRGLLYLESLFGRPNAKDERDAARFLYDRYRQIKRTINRNSSLTTSIIAGSELPTILEHEAMHFPSSGIKSTSNTDSLLIDIPTTIINSPTDNSLQSVQSTDSSDTSSSVHENIHTLSVNELRKQLDIIRDEKKEIRRTIKEFEELFEERNGRKMLKTDRIILEDTYMLYKQKKAKLRLLDALIKKHISK